MQDDVSKLEWESPKKGGTQNGALGKTKKKKDRFLDRCPHGELGAQKDHPTTEMWEDRMRQKLLWPYSYEVTAS